MLADRARWSPSSHPSILPLVCLLLLSLAIAGPARAHQGPPYAILVDRVIGPGVVSIWADPDVGTGTFYVVVEPSPGERLPADLPVEVATQPVSGRKPEERCRARRQPGSAPPQYVAEIPFDRQERVRVRVRIQSAGGGGEAEKEVEVTPPGLGRLDLVLYLLPFLAIGVLWGLAALRRRGPPRASGTAPGSGAAA